MKEKIRTFRDLNVWQKAVELVKEVYKITQDFPDEEKYGLTSQMRRASVSIPSNIAEGFRRRHNKEYRQFLNVALGSSAELETQVVIAKMLGYLDQKDEETLSELIDHSCRMIVNLDKRL